MTSYREGRYRWLHATPDTAQEDQCDCAGRTAIVLQAHLAANPVVCLSCRREVEPGKLGITSALAEEIHKWNGLYESLYLLWLDSGEYEVWAQQRLSDPQGSVNRRGLELVQQLSVYRDAYYWWFVDESNEPFSCMETCPVCGNAMTAGFGMAVCSSCMVIAPVKASRA